MKFNKDFFFADTPETYYFWGFMLGDGCLIQHKQGHRYITVTVKENDECILQNFCKWLFIDPVHIKHGINNSGTRWSRLEIYGNFFKQDFSKFGLVPRKTYNPSNLDIPDEYIKPFLVGLIDADGSVSFDTKRKNGKYFSKEYNLTVVGHPYNMNWIINQFRKIGFDGNINSQIVKGKWKRIRIQKKNDIINLKGCLELHKYYYLCLPRKWKILNDFDDVVSSSGITT